MVLLITPFVIITRLRGTILITLVFFMILLPRVFLVLKTVTGTFKSAVPNILTPIVRIPLTISITVLFLCLIAPDKPPIAVVISRTKISLNALPLSPPPPSVSPRGLPFPLVWLKVPLVLLLKVAPFASKVVPLDPLVRPVLPLLLPLFLLMPIWKTNVLSLMMVYFPTVLGWILLLPTLIVEMTTLQEKQREMPTIMMLSTHTRAEH
mmetsp:Transcript_13720/g.21280  ORF Transcript_13720/g.21280 Transcript_13720/m.21280 type:complete len:208 (+) Transcript_13720:428-1051(+)